jgi:hypothetical protein
LCGGRRQIREQFGLKTFALEAIGKLFSPRPRIFGTSLGIDENYHPIGITWYYSGRDDGGQMRIPERRGTPELWQWMQFTSRRLCVAQRCTRCGVTIRLAASFIQSGWIDLYCRKALLQKDVPPIPFDGKDELS